MTQNVLMASKYFFIPLKGAMKLTGLIFKKRNTMGTISFSCAAFSPHRRKRTRITYLFVDENNQIKKIINSKS